MSRVCCVTRGAVAVMLTRAHTCTHVHSVARYPEVQDLFGPHWITKYIIVATVVLQVCERRFMCAPLACTELWLPVDWLVGFCLRCALLRKSHLSAGLC